MSNNIMDAPHGMNLVVECSDGTICIGRFDLCNGFEVLMHDCDLWDPGSPDSAGNTAEQWVRETATYGVDVKHRDFKLDAHLVQSWKALGEVEKLR
ncbi:MAG: hypothetical protein H6829_04750 [Planctomycetes bacterium]|nr:hypothetical protein [Planctomycetota bacterium]MCB9911951.1 hypothetical protein [Planctomycetota bacterium]HPF13918.1 hypothetical protein [Planctomycetota bacterium]HRV82682.1 hypothetical protein [Planctomycetota bacterium]